MFEFASEAAGKSKLPDIVPEDKETDTEAGRSALREDGLVIYRQRYGGRWQQQQQQQMTEALTRQVGGEYGRGRETSEGGGPITGGI